MRSSSLRHLGRLTRAGVAPAPAPDALRAKSATAVSRAASNGPFEDEFSPLDYAGFLLHIDAEIEHGLMVQYLYAAWSLGGPQVPAHRRDLVREWQETVLGIAKEEMGHLMSVQNVLRLIGAPLNLGREDYPWEIPFYPFPFSLEPLTLDSLAKYIYAESPTGWSDPLAQEIKGRLAHSTPSPHRVGELFDRVIQLIANPCCVPDAAFQPDTYPFQAHGSEWGRGYQAGNRGNTSGDSPRKTPDVLVQPLASRDDAVNSLKAIRDQGEAPQSPDAMPTSHFTRFLKIYSQMKDCASEGWEASRKVAINPYVSVEPGMDPAEGLSGTVTASLIQHPQAYLWASLHNLRYRMLLTYLVHSFTLHGGLSTDGDHSPRGLIINATFGEMYNLRAIGEILMQLPLAPDSAMRAGPPFQMPFTLDSPFGERNRWQGHVELFRAADRLTEQLLNNSDRQRHSFLNSMRQSDARIKAAAERIVSNSSQLWVRTPS